MPLTKQLSSHAQAAKAIRADLKKSFPGVKFSVECVQSSNVVNIHYEDGPTHEQVESVTSKYAKGHFDGQTDSYEYSNRRTDIPQIDYVFVHRGISKLIYAESFDELQMSSFAYLNNDKGWEAHRHVREILSDADLTKGFNRLLLHPLQGV